MTLDAVRMWLLNHPSRASWMAIEVLRPYSVRRKFANAWWQFRHYNDFDEWHGLWVTYNRSRDAA